MSKNFTVYFFSLLLLVSPPLQKSAAANVIISNISFNSLEDRVTQLERIANAHRQLLIQIYQQYRNQQHDVDLLRGQIQENQHRLFQLLEQQKQLYQKIDGLSNQIPAAIFTDHKSKAICLSRKLAGSQDKVTAMNTGVNIDYNQGGGSVAALLKKVF
ncbi:YbgF trimerization domain-containing protein [Candidatus Steffania adelgidicola]|uniref:YbgF trimerization domain-containing protein n=1 Tax=Candidatus Steffania adelgidicola TaxID=1076626 RepID=UPI001D001EDE|nr:YbgF trimerization domain-containing protein [Candidatus Steffania adelgidicola]